MVEREMNRHQRGMVDGCFEEGHYEQGIVYLDQLRMENLMISPAHVRQLIFIALYPPQVQSNIAKDNGRGGPGITSPTKQHKSVKRLHVFFPSPKASENAWRLLHELANSTNSPETILRAVPCYQPTELELNNAPRSVDAKMFADMLTGEDLDSYVAQQAACLKECKDCWNMLRPDVVVRQDAHPTKKGDPFSDMDAEDDYESHSSSLIIGKYSWRLLAWFIHLFEKDQMMVETRHTERFSIYLLSQIKPTHSRSGEPRSSADPALDIIFTCYNQTDGRRRELGSRLMSLLVNLTSSRDFSPSHFLTSTSTRLRACSNDVLWMFLDELPRSERGLAVKVAICDRFLSQSPRGTGNEFDTKGDGRTIPQARRARPVPAQKNADLGSPTKSQAQGRKQDNHYSWTLPTGLRVLQILKPESSVRTPPTWFSSRLIVLYHLIEAFGSIKAAEEARTNENDQAWVDALCNGQLEHDSKATFTVTGLSEKDAQLVQPLLYILIARYKSWKEARATGS